MRVPRAADSDFVLVNLFREPAGASSGGGHHDTTDTEGDMRKPQALARDHAATISDLPQRTHSPRAASRRNSLPECSSNWDQ
jgi:hypothetical protein